MRPGTPQDAVRGVVPGAVYHPASVAEASELLPQLARDRKAVVFVGGGTQLGLGAPPRRLDALVTTAKLSRIVEYVPSDQVVSVEAGVTLAELQETLAKEGQRLAIDPPLPARATLGGIVAANSFGPLRARYGAIRDLIIGATIVRIDGVRAKGGGKVVKNVAGFDLPKLMCGSLGTLGLIATATFRVHPIPESRATVLARGLQAPAVPDLVERIRGAQLEPAALLATRAANGSWDVAVRFEGFAAGVAQQRDRIRLLATVEEVGPAVWAAHEELRTSGELRVKIAAKPTALAEVDAALARLEARVAWYPSLGLGFAVRDAGTAEAVEATRRALSSVGGSLVVEAAPPALRLDPWGPPPPSLRLHRALKSRFDPDALLAPGRFVGGI